MNDPFRLALEQHQQGFLDQAAQLYLQVLARQPHHADAIHLLGVVAHQQGRPVQAIGLISQAIALKPGVAMYHANLAEACRAVGDYDRAAASAREALRLKPDFADPANTLGLLLLEQNQPAAAIEQFELALTLKPNFALTCNNLGNAHRLQGDIDQALACFQKALDIDPHLAEAHSNLGQLLLEENQPHKALLHCREAVRLRPNSAEAHSNLGNVLRELGRLDEAKQCYTQALHLNPRLAMLYNNMGQALQEEGKAQEAIAWYERGLTLDPKLARLHCNLASVLVELENHAEAIVRYETALRLDPNYADAHTGLGWVWHEQGRYEEAQERYRQVLRLKPNFAPALGNLGQVRAELGDFTGAEQYLRRALDRDPRLAGAWNQLATHLRARLPAEDVAAMRTLLKDGDLNAGKRSALHFGLAQVLDAHKEYDEAGEHLVKANAIALAQWRARGQGYEPAAHQQFVDRLIDSFQPQYFARVREFGSVSQRPIFIVGLPRSGTTLTEQILARHSQVFGAGELSLAQQAFMRLGNGNVDKAFDALGQLMVSTTVELANWHLDRLRALNDAAPRVADKMPDNYLYLGLLAMLFPKAKFIHCRRDLRDVAVSCWMTSFRSIRWASDPEHIASRFHEYQRLMQYWRSVLPVEMLEVDYEDTVSDVEATARRLVKWCGLDWEPACVAFHEGKQPVRTASVSQVRQPIYRRSVGRWQNYERSLGPVFRRLAAFVPSTGR
jgi:tetratricopeptide (TPR) repeat protein